MRGAAICPTCLTRWRLNRDNGVEIVDCRVNVSDDPGSMNVTINHHFVFTEEARKQVGPEPVLNFLAPPMAVPYIVAGDWVSFTALGDLAFKVIGREIRFVSANQLDDHIPARSTASGMSQRGHLRLVQSTPKPDQSAKESNAPAGT